MKQFSSIVIRIFIIAFSVYSYADTEVMPAPDFTLKSNSGSNIRLAEQRGNVVMLNFWASWCAPCRQEMPHLNALSQQYSALGFNLMGINVDEDPQAANRAINNLKVAFPVLFDSDSRIAELFSVDAMPTTIIIDKDGNIRHWHRGYQAGYEDSYAEQVAQLIRE
ncbi:MAG TPA: TlpA family protein disulfide reductase [Cellvibrionales bacterium]|jgi:peroxiredoxin|nr:TlpA family protein disulfide reductase [Cellvibrionales bacterium]